MTVWEDTIARPLRALHLDTTRNQILVFAVVATVIPTLATTCVSYTQNRRWLADKVTQELRSASSEAAREADLWLKERLAEHQGLTLAGNAYSGIGISDCIRTGEAAAKRAVAQAAEGRPVPEPVAGSSAS